MTREQYQLLYDTIKYEEVCLLDISNAHEYSIDDEKGYIIDKDLCIIELNWRHIADMVRLGDNFKISIWGLRALLIQKEIKPISEVNLFNNSLRALLIQKEIKLMTQLHKQFHRLRALLIQKEIKLSKFRTLITYSLRALLIQKEIKQ